ncbi:unnamed protein product [Medioppia subpectinata]|uniref:Protein FRA10AC1 n=1 Tax=Medioppia subpectinata TaxID=1979941 RepID=A0A7R9Q609_9ACAR|nr:unnamed protein product [Medioppia subpectinata]CAG2114316.1 unnamed protein product [Medioppia subpectinata]
MSADYESNFDTESEAEDKRSVKRQSREDWSATESSAAKQLRPSKNVLVDETDKTERIIRNRFQTLSAYSRHKMLVNEYILNYSGSTAKLVRDTSRDVTEYQVLKDNHRFIWDDVSEDDLSWGQRLAKKYYNLLFKEYCICDLSRYKDNKFGMRWRTEKEVLEGKGQFGCGGKGCANTEALKSWEVLFKYEELGEQKSALVKLRLCEDCSPKLNYRQKRREIKRHKKSHKKSKSDKSKKPSDGEEGVEVSEPEVSSSSANTSHEITDTVNEIWTKPQIIADTEQPIDDEFDRYLDDLLV